MQSNLRLVSTLSGALRDINKRLHFPHLFLSLASEILKYVVNGISIINLKYQNITIYSTVPIENHTVGTLWYPCYTLLPFLVRKLWLCINRSHPISLLSNSFPTYKQWHVYVTMSYLHDTPIDQLQERCENGTTTKKSFASDTKGEGCF